MRNALNWGLFVIVLAGAWVLAGPAHLGGPASYVIVDGRSMEPTYENGDLVVARARNQYDIGDVIIYDAPIDTQFEVIHRVVEPTDGGYITQGDNMARPDGWIAPHETIHGAAQFHVPNGGAVVAFLRQPAAILGLLGGLIAFEVLKRAEKRRDDEDEGGQTSPGADGGATDVDGQTTATTGCSATKPWTNAPVILVRRPDPRPVILDRPAVIGVLVGLSASRFASHKRAMCTRPAGPGPAA